LAISEIPLLPRQYLKLQALLAISGKKYFFKRPEGYLA